MSCPDKVSTFAVVEWVWPFSYAVHILTSIAYCASCIGALRVQWVSSQNRVLCSQCFLRTYLGAVQYTQGCKMCTCSLTDLKYSCAGRSELVMKHHIHIQPAAIALRTGFVTMIRLNYWMDENHESHMWMRVQCI